MHIGKSCECRSGDAVEVCEAGWEGVGEPRIKSCESLSMEDRRRRWRRDRSLVSSKAGGSKTATRGVALADR